MRDLLLLHCSCSQAYRTNCIRSNYKGKDYSNIIIFKECNKIKLPKLGLVKIRGYRSLEKIDGNIINATITKETTGKYYVSVIVEEKEIIKSKVEPKSIIGIDLGSSGSVVSVLNEVGEPIIAVNANGEYTTPSVVMIKNGERQIGSSAKRQQIMNPKNTVSFI